MKQWHHLIWPKVSVKGVVHFYFLRVKSPKGRLAVGIVLAQVVLGASREGRGRYLLYMLRMTIVFRTPSTACVKSSLFNHDSRGSDEEGAQPQGVIEAHSAMVLTVELCGTQLPSYLWEA